MSEDACPKCKGHRLTDGEVAALVRALGITEAELRTAEIEHFESHARVVGTDRQPPQTENEETR